MTVEDTH